MEEMYNSENGSDYSLVGRIYRSKSLGDNDQAGQCWDSELGSDLCPNQDERGEGEWESGLLPSEPGCTCEEQQQPDTVKVENLKL